MNNAINTREYSLFGAILGKSGPPGIKPDLAGNRKAQFFASIFRVGRTLAEYLAANLARNLPGT